MNHFFRRCAALILSSATWLAACNKDKVNDPQPVEQELITTVRLNVTDSFGFNQLFSYKVTNGFGTGTGTKTIDTVRLASGKTYDVSLSVLNEQKNPTEDVTLELIAERNEHLFLFGSNPATGGGAIEFKDGSKDGNNQPFNQTLRFTTGAAGVGKLTVTLKHAPTNKQAATPDAAGGETDAEAIFPVVLQ